MKQEVKKLQWGFHGMIPFSDTAEKLGLNAYVRIENYNFIQKKTENLEAEVARLKAEVERLDNLCKQLMKQHSDISCENIMLRKVGDEMAALFGGDYSDIDGVCYDRKWNAAKDGKATE
jgi:hypothetical protein